MALHDRPFPLWGRVVLSLHDLGNLNHQDVREDFVKTPLFMHAANINERIYPAVVKRG